VTYQEPDPQLLQRKLPAGDARVAVFHRTYPTSIEDLWDACTNPERLSRWYVPVTGDLRLGGEFEQVNMGSGIIVACEPPRHFTLSLAGGVDEIDVRLRHTDDPDVTTLELQHATTCDSHEIGGQLYDAIFCMGGGYYPRLLALELHLRGALPGDYDSSAFHLNPLMHPVIERGSAAMQALLDG
jgi:uncharacterized protein YndB with AHSA1/START domain